MEKGILAKMVQGSTEQGSITYESVREGTLGKFVIHAEALGKMFAGSDIVGSSLVVTGVEESPFVLARRVGFIPELDERADLDIILVNIDGVDYMLVQVLEGIVFVETEEGKIVGLSSSGNEITYKRELGWLEADTVRRYAEYRVDFVYGVSDFSGLGKEEARARVREYTNNMILGTSVETVRDVKKGGYLRSVTVHSLYPALTDGTFVFVVEDKDRLLSDELPEDQEDELEYSVEDFDVFDEGGEEE